MCILTYCDFLSTSFDILTECFNLLSVQILRIKISANRNGDTDVGTSFTQKMISLKLLIDCNRSFKDCAIL